MKNYFFVLLFIGYFSSSYAQTNQIMTSKWRLNLSGGLGYITAGTAVEENFMIGLGFNEKNVKDLYRDFKNGIQAGADIHYFLNDNIGLGIKSAFFTTSGSIKQTFTIPPTSGYSVPTLGIKETDYVYFIGPSLHARSFIVDSRWAFSYTISGGYANIREKSESSESYNNNKPNLSHISAKGNAFGAFGGIGLEC